MSAGTELTARVARLARQRWWSALVGGLLMALAVVVAAVLVLVALDHGLDLPPALRLLGLLALIAIAGTAVILLLVRPVLARGRMAATARALERQLGLDDNRVINGCQLAGRELDRDASACAETIARSGLAAMERLDIQAFLALRRGINAAFALALLGLAWGTYAVTYPHHLRHAAERVLYPLRPSGEIGAAVISLQPSGEVRRYAGGALSVEARIQPLGDEEVLIDPELVVGEVGGDPALGERQAMALTGAGFRGVARDLQRDRVLRVEALASRSAPLRVRVVPPPRAGRLAFSVSPPAYAGGEASELPAGDLDLLAGSTLRLRCAVDGRHGALSLVASGHEVALTREGEGWSGALEVETSGSWQLRAAVPEELHDPATEDHLVLASGALRIAPDRAPQVRIDLVERNAFLPPGAELELPVVASDDHGLRMLAVTATDSVDQAEFSRLATWPYLGPPGRAGTVRERLRVTLDPRFFRPGRSYVIRAVARDFRPPSGQATRSEPVVVRIQQPQQLTTGGDAGRRRAFAALQAAVTAQDRARGRTAQVRANRPPPGEALVAAAEALAEAQDEADAALVAAREAVAESSGGERHLGAIERLRRGDAALATRAIERLVERPAVELDPALGLLRRHQDEVFVRLVALLGRFEQPAPAVPTVDTKHQLEALRDHLRDLARQQRRLAERGEILVERRTQGLDLALEALLAERGREQDHLLLLLEARGDELADLPDQAATVGPAGHGWDRVASAMRHAGDALFAFAPAETLPHQRSAADLAHNLVAALDAWIDALPGEQRWATDGPGDEDAELEQMVGELLSDLEGMDDAPGSLEAEAAAALAPEPPTQDPVAGLDVAQVDDMASLEDRTSVREPERDPLDPTAAPPPPELRARMQRLAQQQTGIRQQAAEIALELRARGYPSGDLEAAVAALHRVAAAASRGDAVDLRQAHHAAIDALGRANRQVATEARVRRERAPVRSGFRPLDVEDVREQIPAGYEAMVERYFQALQGRELP